MEISNEKKDNLNLKSSTSGGLSQHYMRDAPSPRATQWENMTQKTRIIFIQAKRGRRPSWACFRFLKFLPFPWGHWWGENWLTKICPGLHTDGYRFTDPFLNILLPIHTWKFFGHWFLGHWWGENWLTKLCPGLHTDGYRFRTRFSMKDSKWMLHFEYKVADSKPSQLAGFESATHVGKSVTFILLYP